MLVVDDEPQILRALQTTLRGAGYHVETAATAEEALAVGGGAAAGGGHPRPRASRRERHRGVPRVARVERAPVIVLSAVGDEREKIAALDAGADDYVTKPFSVDELLARLRAVLRRPRRAGEPVIEIGDLRIDLGSASSVGGERVKLNPHEFDLLRVLAQNRGQAPHPPRALREVWGPPTGGGALPPRLRLAPAEEDRARPDEPALPPDRARRGLCSSIHRGRALSKP